MRFWYPLEDVARDDGLTLMGRGDHESVVALGSAYDRRLVLASGDDGQLGLWEVGRGPVTRYLSGQREPLSSLAFGACPDGRLVLAVGLESGAVQLWDPLTPCPIDEISVGSTAPIRSIGLAADDEGRLVLAVGSESGLFLLVDDEPPAPSGVFISYRREDAPHFAGRLYDALAVRFGGRNVFRDVDNIGLSRDFVAELDDALARSRMMLVVIGGRWAAERLRNPRDFVRVEIEHALRSDIPIVPVFVDDAVMPNLEDLPASLADFTRKNGLRISRDRLDTEIASVVAAIERPPSIRQV